MIAITKAVINYSRGLFTPPRPRLGSSSRLTLQRESSLLAQTNLKQRKSYEFEKYIQMVQEESFL